MSVPDRSIDPRLLSAAKEEFLRKGYEMSSLVKICEAAGVTTGALYKRYKGKEELFSAVVYDTVREMEEYFDAEEKRDLAQLTDRELFDAFVMDPETDLRWLQFLFERKEGFTLLIKCASGTRYGNFHHDWSEKMNVLVYKYYLEARKRGMAQRELTADEMHILTSAVWELFYEPFIHDFTWEQMKRYTGVFHDFIDWHKALGLRMPD